VIRVRAPATTANVGPGFDCAAIALDLWNELEVGEGGEASADLDHLGVQAFALLADPTGRSFRFTDRIPRERGLGSSAATVALGLVAGAIAAGRELDPEELLRIGFDLEGHADNLAAALAGGVCLTWGRRIARVAAAPPAVPIAVVPEGTQVTLESRKALPEDVPHRDASAHAARAAMLGAALALEDAALFASAAQGDRLHEPYRSPGAPLLAALRAELPEGAVAVTLSGSGPSVIVWAQVGAEASCAAALERRHPDAAVLLLDWSSEGAGPLET
jgi:homoserine kinase